jgi:hypothetical protein
MAISRETQALLDALIPPHKIGARPHHNVAWYRDFTAQQEISYKALIAAIAKLEAERDELYLRVHQLGRINQGLIDEIEGLKGNK